MSSHVLHIPVFMGFYRTPAERVELRRGQFPLGLRSFAAGHGGPSRLPRQFPGQPSPAFHGDDPALAGAPDPARAGVDPAQQKMMRYMPLMFILFFYKTSAAYSLLGGVKPVNHRANESD